MSSFELLEAREYYARLLKAVSRAKRYINITSYDLIYDASTQALLDTIVNAAERGVKVTLSADTMTFNELRGRSFGPINPDHPSTASIHAYVDTLRRAGGTFTWLGKMLVINSYIQRNHEKWSIVDDEVFGFGGINMYDKGLLNTDYMLFLKNAQLADMLREQHNILLSDPQNYTGYSATVDSQSTIYIDSAATNSSQIYSRACELAERAASAMFVSQFYPTGPLATRLKKIDTTYYTNRPEQMSAFIVRTMQRVDAWRTGAENSYTKDNYLHAKCIIFTMRDGSKVALTGSHNFSYAGVRFGTVESELETRDPHVITQLEAFIKKTVA